MTQAFKSNPSLPSSNWLKTLDSLLSAAEQEAKTRSEARYLHVCRDGVWFGIRIATHIPVYSCSCDYAQIITSLEPHRTERRFFTRLIREKVIEGGNIVANPTLIHEYFGLSYEAFRTLDTRRQAQLRHRANRIAAWSCRLESA